MIDSAAAAALLLIDIVITDRFLLLGPRSCILSSNVLKYSVGVQKPSAKVW